MRCHYCDAEAAYAAESQGVRVGLCEDHLKKFVSQCVDKDLQTAIAALGS